MATSQQPSAPPDGSDLLRELCAAPYFLISWLSNAYFAFTIPEGPSASVFNSWFDDPSLGGAGPSGQSHGRMELSGCYPPWQSAAIMAGPLAHRPQCFEFGSTATPIMDQGLNPSIITHNSIHQQQRNAGPCVPTSSQPLNTFGTSLTFDPMGYTDPASITELVQPEYLSSAVGIELVF